MDLNAILNNGSDTAITLWFHQYDHGVNNRQRHQFIYGKPANSTAFDYTNTKIYLIPSIQPTDQELRGAPGAVRFLWVGMMLTEDAAQYQREIKKDTSRKPSLQPIRTSDTALLVVIPEQRKIPPTCVVYVLVSTKIYLMKSHQMQTMMKF